MKRVLLLLLLKISSIVCFADEYKDTVYNVIYTFDPAGTSAEVKPGEEWDPADDGATEYSIPGSPDAKAEIIILDRFSVDGKEYIVSKIGDYAFLKMRNILSVSIPSSIEVVGAGAFLGCTSLSNVVLSEGLKSIGSGAFEWTGLLSITIPSSVESIELAAFSTTPLTTITSLIESPFEVPNICKPSQQEQIILRVPVGTKSKYEATSGWNQFSTIEEFFPTGIELPFYLNSKPSTRPKGTLDPSRTLNCYDLSGRRLSVPSASSSRSVLPKGVYIENGKKRGRN